MNVRTNKITRQKKTQQTEVVWAHNFFLVAKLISLALIVVIIASSYIHFNEQIKNIERNIQKTTREINVVEREIKSLENKYAVYSSPKNIQERITHFNLKLRPYEPNQVRDLYFASTTSRVNSQVSLSMND